ncbi:MAG: hypothetical protein GY866_16615, partial [Proteobacteria bacterium]|nr:hypothetical protein [Pseudomonadota bacterium]
EGLPEEVSDDVNFYLYNEFDLQIPVLLGSSEHAGFDPLYEEEIVERNGNQTLKRDFTGSLVKVFTDGSSTPPHFIDFPVTDRESWEQVKPRLDPDTPGRLEPYVPFIDMAKENPWPLIVYIPGVFGTHRHLLGFDKLMLGYYDQPDLLHQISRHWLHLWKSVVARIHRESPVDAVSLWEDMCGKNGPLIGPDMFESFMSPYYRELVEFVKNELNIPIVAVDTDGDLTRIIPKFVEAGVNLLYPFEVQAGMDVLKVRDQWPDQFAIFGGIDKRALALDRAAIRSEVQRVVPKMLEKGGYIPSLDHNVPPDVSLENWLYYRDLVREVSGG